MATFTDSNDYFKDVAVYTHNLETGEHKLVFDFAALKQERKQAEADAYLRGLAEGQRVAENTNGTTDKLAQIDRMARQIEECHATIRRRNQEIKDLEADVRRLSQPCCCKGGN